MLMKDQVELRQIFPGWAKFHSIFTWVSQEIKVNYMVERVKLRKSNENEIINKKKNKKNGSWDRIQQYIKIMSENIESIGKSLNHISSNSTVTRKNEIHNSNLKKKNKVYNKTFTDLNTALNRLKASKININTINKGLDEKSITYSYKLPN